MEQRIKALSKEEIAIVPHDPQWAAQALELEKSLKRIVPRMLMLRVCHIGSTAIPGISAKPIIDIQVEVSDMEAVRTQVVPLMESAGYEFIWRPTMGDDDAFYAWFILRNEAGQRVAHVHMVRPGQASVDRIIFRDHLRNDPESAGRYEALKLELATRFRRNRIAYTEHKTDFINEILAKARREKMKR